MSQFVPILGLIVLFSLAMRALLVAQRRLAYRAAVERRQAEMAARQAELEESEDDAETALRVEEPEVDLAGLSDDTRDLLRIVAVVAGLLGLSALWSPVFSALTIFEGVTLWHRTVTVDGEEQSFTNIVAYYEVEEDWNMGMPFEFLDGPLGDPIVDEFPYFPDYTLGGLFPEMERDYANFNRARRDFFESRGIDRTPEVVRPLLAQLI